MSIEETICRAMEERNLLQFVYEGRTRVVEPHMLAANDEEHLALSAWIVRGYSKSADTPYWREYLISKMSSPTILSETFAGTRPGYKESGGEVFHRIRCRL